MLQGLRYGHFHEAHRFRHHELASCFRHLARVLRRPMLVLVHTVLFELDAFLPELRLNGLERRWGVRILRFPPCADLTVSIKDVKEREHDLRGTRKQVETD